MNEVKIGRTGVTVFVLVTLGLLALTAVFCASPDMPLWRVAAVTVMLLGMGAFLLTIAGNGTVRWQRPIIRLLNARHTERILWGLYCVMMVIQAIELILM